MVAGIAIKSTEFQHGFWGMSLLQQSKNNLIVNSMFVVCINLHKGHMLVVIIHLIKLYVFTLPCKMAGPCSVIQCCTMDKMFVIIETEKFM